LPLAVSVIVTPCVKLHWFRSEYCGTNGSAVSHYSRSLILVTTIRLRRSGGILNSSAASSMAVFSSGADTVPNCSAFLRMMLTDQRWGCLAMAKDGSWVGSADCHVEMEGECGDEHGAEETSREEDKRSNILIEHPPSIRTGIDSQPWPTISRQHGASSVSSLNHNP